MALQFSHSSPRTHAVTLLLRQLMHPLYHTHWYRCSVTTSRQGQLNRMEPVGCGAWVGKWEIDCTHTRTDEHGWAYALDFGYLNSRQRNNNSLSDPRGCYVRPSSTHIHINHAPRLTHSQHRLLTAQSAWPSNSSDVFVC